MNIILASEVIHPGGAETFILRLADALHKKGHTVHVFVFYKELLNRELCRILAPEVPIVTVDIPFARLLKKIDGLLFRLKADVSLRNYFLRRALRNLIRQQQTDVIHSHLLKVDRLCLSVAREAGVPVVNTIHGDYLLFFNKTKQGIHIPLLNYTTKAKKNLSALKQVVCISDKQLAFFKTYFPIETKGKLSKIYNGYKGNITAKADALKAQLGIEPGEFVFGMVSRGIPEKGWQVAIESFIRMNRPGAHLVLTGSSDYLTELKREHTANKNIYFTGHSDNPIDWISIFDAGLLPSTYPSESLPTVIIEYLCCGIPVIASDAGEITNMTGQEEHPAGIIVPVRNGSIDADEFAAAMLEYANGGQLYREHKNNTVTCYELFDMDKCVAAYESVYSKAINDNHT